MTEAVDQVYGVNHNQIDSIAHRTMRYLRAQSGGILRAQPVMIGLPKTPEDAANIRRIVHNTESIYGILVSLDDKAALIRANFIEGRLDYRRIFTEVNERVIAPFEKGWFGALIKGKDPLKPDQPSPAVIEAVYRDTPAAEAGLKPGDVITAVDGTPTADRTAVAQIVSREGSRQPGDDHRQARRGRRDRQDHGARARHQHLRGRRAAPLRLGVQLRRRRLLDLHAHLLHRVGAALDVLPRLARRAAADASPASSRRSGASASSI